MARERNPTIVPPIGGVRRRDDYQNQAPFTAFDANNARGIDTQERRVRVASRPTTKRAFAEQLGSGNPVRLLQTVEVAPSDNQIVYEDHFLSSDGDLPYESDVWSYFGIRPYTLPPTHIKTSVSQRIVGLMHTGLDIDPAENYTVSIPIEYDNNGEEYILFVRVEEDGDPTYNGIIVRVILAALATPNGLRGEVNVYVNGVITQTVMLSGTGYTPGDTYDLEVLVSVDNVYVSFGGTDIMLLGPLALTASEHAALSDLRFGFTLEGLASPTLLASIDAFRVYYTSTGTAVDTKRNILVASSNKILYSEATIGTLSSVPSDGFTTTIGVDFPSDRILLAQDRGQKLYIANHTVIVQGTDGVVSVGDLDALDSTVVDFSTIDLRIGDVVWITNGTGNVTDGLYYITGLSSDKLVVDSDIGDGACDFRVEASPRIYDPLANKYSQWKATAGTMPIGNPLIALYQDRMVLAGADLTPHGWFMSRSGTPTDFDLLGTGVGRAINHTNADAGQVGQMIRGMVSYSDDYLIFGCLNSMWVLRGAPTLGGRLDNLSYTVGMLSSTSCCMTPEGMLVWLSSTGLYGIATGAGGAIGQPTMVSEEVLPVELRGLNPITNTIVLTFDTVDNGIHIFVTPNTGGGGLHYYYSWRTKGFWPVTLDSTQEPFTSVMRNTNPPSSNAVIMGGRDGRLRRFDPASTSDDGIALSSFVLIGPLRMGSSDHLKGIVRRIVGVLDSDSSPVTIEAMVGRNAEEASVATPRSLGTLTAGMNGPINKKISGHTMFIKITGDGTGPWSLEKLSLVVKDFGLAKMN